MGTEGFEKAKDKVLQVLEDCKVTLTEEERAEVLSAVSSTSLGTKVHPVMAEQLSPIVVQAVEAVKQGNKPIDLHMVELMEMQHRSETDTTLVKGLVLDHGGRHPDMPKRLENCYILTC